MEASARKKFGHPSLKEDVTNSLAADICAVVCLLSSRFLKSRHKTKRPT